MQKSKQTLHRSFQHLYTKTGITLVETLIAMLIFAGVSAGAYKVFTSSTQKAIETQKEAIKNRKLRQFFETFRHQIENTLQLPNSASTALQVQIPIECVNLAEHPQIMGWGFIPFPGHDMALMNSTQNTFNVINPLNFTGLVSSTSSDAIRMVYLLPETQVFELALTGTPEAPYSTAQSVGDEPIIITSAVAPDLKVGDFAVISDARRSDLFRITSINVGSNSNEYDIGHRSAVSSWNIDFIDNYGQNVEGNAFIYKVGTATYALDTDTNTLMMDTHYNDDGFNGTDFTGGTPGMAMQWTPVASGISNFQVTVDTISGETRTPMAGVPGKTYSSCTSTSPRTPEYCECESQLGNPGIRKIDINIAYVE